MIYDTDLKIEFRAVPYLNGFLGYTHKLECRISPEQDLTYKTHKSFLGLFTYKVKRQYDTSWQTPEVFMENGQFFDIEDECWIPILFKKDDGGHSEFEWYKESFQTVGEFWDYIDMLSATRRKEWRKKKEEIWE